MFWFSFQKVDSDDSKKPKIIFLLWHTKIKICIEFHEFIQNSQIVYDRKPYCHCCKKSHHHYNNSLRITITGSLNHTNINTSIKLTIITLKLQNQSPTHVQTRDTNIHCFDNIFPTIDDHF